MCIFWRLKRIFSFIVYFIVMKLSQCLFTCKTPTTIVKWNDSGIILSGSAIVYHVLSAARLLINFTLHDLAHKLTNMNSSGYNLHSPSLHTTLLIAPMYSQFCHIALKEPQYLWRERISAKWNWICVGLTWGNCTADYIAYVTTGAGRNVLDCVRFYSEQISRFWLIIIVI